MSGWASGVKVESVTSIVTTGTDCTCGLIRMDSPARRTCIGISGVAGGRLEWMGARNGESRGDTCHTRGALKRYEGSLRRSLQER